jgi:hypothetical protein
MTTQTMKLCLALGCFALAACEGASSKGASGSSEASDDAGNGSTHDSDAGLADGDDAAANREDAGSDSDAVVPDCYTNPKNYLEIINACTDAEKVDKHPDLPRLLADGGLPDLP